MWEKDAEKTAAFNIGSRLKTPSLPMWMTKCNGQMGILFNPNKELMRSYHAENRFQLYYFSNFEFKKEDRKETVLTIDTRRKGTGPVSNDMDNDYEDNTEPPVESAIKTKYVNNRTVYFKTLLDNDKNS